MLHKITNVVCFCKKGLLVANIVKRFLFSQLIEADVCKNDACFHSMSGMSVMKQIRKHSNILVNLKYLVLKVCMGRSLRVTLVEGFHLAYNEHGMKVVKFIWSISSLVLVG